MVVHQLTLTYGTAVVLGLGYAFVAYRMKRDADEPFKPKKAARTAIMFVVASVAVTAAGGDVTQAAIQSQLTSAGWVGFVGILFDHAWSALRRAGYLDWVPGAKPAE